jgi:hypothetical protein
VWNLIEGKLKMNTQKHGIRMMVAEHLSGGSSITRLEALTLFGVQNLPEQIRELRREGWNIKTRKILFVEAVRRVNNYATYTPPKNLPISEILLTDYWLSK